MPSNRPSLERIRTRTRNDIDVNLDTAGTGVSRSVERALAESTSGASHGIYSAIDYAVSQSVPDDLLDDPQISRWAAVFGLFRSPAQVASGITIAVTGTATTVIPLTAEWSLQGVSWVPTEEVTIDLGGVATVPITAVEVGSSGNVPGGTTISLTSPIAGVDANATVNGTIGVLQGTGADAQTSESLLADLQSHLRNPPRGGTTDDFVFWAKLGGASRAWVEGNFFGPGTVKVITAIDNFNAEGSFTSTVFPDGATLATIQSSLDTYAPVPGVPIAITAAALPLDVEVTLVPDTTAVREQVDLQLQDLVLRRGGPSVTIALSEITEAISQAPGETSHTLVSPTADVTTTALEVHTLGVTSYA